MGIDEAGVDHHAGGVDDLVGLPQLGADVLDGVVPDEQIAPLIQAVGVVAGDDVAGVFNQLEWTKKPPIPNQAGA